VQREQAAERGAGDAGRRAIRPRAVVPVDPRLDLVGQHAAEVIGVAAAAPPAHRRVVVGAVQTRVVDADQDQRLDLLAVDQLLRGRAGVPGDAGECGVRREQVLAVLQVEHRIAVRRVGVVVLRQPDPNHAAGDAEAGSNEAMRVQLHRPGVSAIASPERLRAT